MGKTLPTHHTYKWLGTKKHFIICGYFITPSDAVTL